MNQQTAQSPLPLSRETCHQADPIIVRRPRSGARPWASKLGLHALVAMSGRSEQALRVATSFVARSLATAHFHCGHDAGQYYQDYFAWRPAFWWLRQGMAIDLDPGRSAIAAEVFGIARQQAFYREILGSVTHNLDAPVPGLPPNPSAWLGGPEPQPVGDLAVGQSQAPVPGNGKLAEILRREMAPREDRNRAATKALLVVKDGKLAGEAYAPGYDETTPIIGYSLAKAMCNAVAGRMVETGLIDPDERDLCAEWREGADRRRDITIAQLLQMTSGLRIAETHSGFDPVSHMLFLSEDMGEFAARSALGAEPGQQFEYTSANTLLVSRLMRDRLGGGAEVVLNYLHGELLARLGIERLLVEFDATGTPILSTFCYASARDWARLGLLYLNDGCVGSTRLLPHDWVDFTKTPSVEPSYGAGLRLSRAGGQGDRWLLAGMPHDSFYAHGHLGQYVVVIPSLNAVIVRLGTSSPAMRQRDRAVLAEITAAISVQ